MKLINTLLTILFISLLSSPSWSVNFFTDLEERDGLYYKKLTDVPYTGKVTGHNLTGSLKDGKQEGTWVFIWSKDQIWYKGNRKNGKRVGTWVYYHDNGQLWEKGNYKNGKKHGAWVWYWKNGQLKYKDNYKNGKKHGAQVLYHNNGQLFRKGNYKSGEREGAWVSYNNDGTVITSLTGTFKDGVKISD